MLTPVTAIKGQCDLIKHRNRAADVLFSRAVSKIRQPIEGFSKWLIEKTIFQRASKVRSIRGLMIIAFGKLAAAFIESIF